MKRVLTLSALCLLLTPAAAAPGGTQLKIGIDNLRNTRGMLQLCLSSAATAYPDCKPGTPGRRLSVPATQAGSIVFDGLAPGTYALSVLHDENGNGRMETTLGAPREGFGFSMNPPVGFGAPAFRRVSFQVGGTVTRQSVRMRYLL